MKEAYGLITVFFLGRIAWMDYRIHKIPNKVLLFWFAVRTGTLVMECLWCRELCMCILVEAGTGLVFGGGIFLLCYLISRKGLGAGDVKLLAVLGYQLGLEDTLYVVFTAFLLTILFSMIMPAWKKNCRTQKLPLGPFVFLGYILWRCLNHG